MHAYRHARTLPDVRRRCLQTHIGRIVFGAWDAKLGACGSVWDIPRDPHIGSVPEVIGGMHESECARILTDFFTDKRIR